MDSNLIKLIEEVSEELNIDINIVSLVVTSEFKFCALKMRENISTGEDSELILNYLGKFKVKKGRRKAIEEKREKLVNELILKGKETC